eukprot:355021-Chlamydomonas_euryale.AAC.2
MAPNCIRHEICSSREGIAGMPPSVAAAFGLQEAAPALCGAKPGRVSAAFKQTAPPSRRISWQWEMCTSVCFGRTHWQKALATSQSCAPVCIAPRPDVLGCAGKAPVLLGASD